MHCNLSVIIPLDFNIKNSVKKCYDVLKHCPYRIVDQTHKNNKTLRYSDTDIFTLIFGL